ncbi:acid resistance repetitive basic protein Asr [Serratia sp. D1N4]
MKKVLALIVAATMGLSSIAFAADTAAPAAAPAATDTMAAPAHGTKATHHKKEHKKATTKAPEQKAQAAKAKKHSKKAPEQKAQAAKKHHKDSKKAAAPAAK